MDKAWREGLRVEVDKLIGAVIVVVQIGDWTRVIMEMERSKCV